MNPSKSAEQSCATQIRDRIKELRRVPASALVRNPKNWRRHPKAQADALRGLLTEVGYSDALLARELPDGRLVLIDGHLRAETTPNSVAPGLGARRYRRGRREDVADARSAGRNVETDILMRYVVQALEWPARRRAFETLAPCSVPIAVPKKLCLCLISLAPPVGFEPTTS